MLKIMDKKIFTILRWTCDVWVSKLYFFLDQMATDTESFFS